MGTLEYPNPNSRKISIFCSDLLQLRRPHDGNYDSTENTLPEGQTWRRHTLVLHRTPVMIHRPSLSYGPHQNAVRKEQAGVNSSFVHHHVIRLLGENKGYQMVGRSTTINIFLSQIHTPPRVTCVSNIFLHQ